MSTSAGRDAPLEDPSAGRDAMLEDPSASRDALLMTSIIFSNIFFD